MNVDALVSLRALEVAADEGVVPHLARLDEALGRASPSERAVLEAVRFALACHLALLRRHPDALWPCLYAHLAFIDSPAARAWGLAAHEIAPAWEQVERWLAERAELHRGAPWVRALSPLICLGGSLRAELRGLDEPRVTRVRSGEVFLTVRGGTRCWTPADGAVDERAAPSPAVKVAAPYDGGMTLTLGGRSLRLLDDQWRACGWSVDEAGTRAVVTAEGPEEIELDFRRPCRVFVFELERGRELYSADAGAWCQPSISPNGRFIAYARLDREVVSRGDDGLIRPMSLDSRSLTTSAAVSDDGAVVAVACGDAVELHAVPAPALRTPWTYSSVPMFSLDGSLVMLGRWICDAATGLPLSQHSHRSGSWLEGGPPPRSVRLTRQRLFAAEMRLRAWDVATGAQTSPVEREAFTLSQRVAFSADGLVIAFARQGAERVTIVANGAARQIEVRGGVEALALDTTGSTLAVLLQGGTLALHPSLQSFRAIPGAEDVGFLANDTAIAAGGRRGVVVLSRGGRELWQSRSDEPRRFVADDATLAALEHEAGLRARSVAEELAVELVDGATRFRAPDGASAIFPRAGEWLPSPAGASLALGTTLVKLER